MGARGGPLTIRLTARRATILQLLAEGASSKEIAARYRIRPSSVDEAIAWLEHRLGARTRAQLVYRAVEEGLLPVPRDIRDSDDGSRAIRTPFEEVKNGARIWKD